MMLRLITCAFLLAGSLAAQTFIQMSDPQFGMYTKDADFAHETANFEFAIATANRLKPAFVVVTGDLINKAATRRRRRSTIASRQADPKIKLYSVPGNHDVGNEPTAESLALYRERYGADYYSFRSGDIAGIVLNSNLEKGDGEGAGRSRQDGGVVPRRVGEGEAGRSEAHDRVPAYFAFPERREGGGSVLQHSEGGARAISEAAARVWGAAGFRGALSPE